MFRNKILVRAAPPRPLSSSTFLLLPLTLSSPPPHFLSTTIDSLCWKLSRRWRVACLPNASQILVVYQRSQSQIAAGVVEELKENAPVSDVGDEEEVVASSVISRAIECGLRCLMLDNGWRCVGEDSFVLSSFDVSEERKHLYGVNVKVQSDTDDDFILIVSPDILRFSRHKISDLVGPKLLKRFNDGEEVSLEDCKFSTSCATLPSLYEGHIKGLSKQLPFVDDSETVEEFWLLKHGFALSSDYFIHVQLPGTGSTGQWFPSTFVLQGSGLAPAPQRIRASQAVKALGSFLDIIGAWNFFNQGLLRIKEVSSLAIGTTLPVWQKATAKIMNDADSSVNDASSGLGHESLVGKASIPEDMLLASASHSMTLEPTEMHVSDNSSSNKAPGSISKSVQVITSTDTTTTIRPFHRKPCKRNTHSGNTSNAILFGTSTNATPMRRPLYSRACENNIHSENDVSASEEPGHHESAGRQNQLGVLEGKRDDQPTQPTSEASENFRNADDFHGKNHPDAKRVLRGRTVRRGRKNDKGRDTEGLKEKHPADTERELRGQPAKRKAGNNDEKTRDNEDFKENLPAETEIVLREKVVRKRAGNNDEKTRNTKDVSENCPADTERGTTVQPILKDVLRGQAMRKRAGNKDEKIRNTEDFNENHPPDTEIVVQGQTQRKRARNKDEKMIHGKESAPEISKKARTKQSPELSDITGKVLNCHKTGELASLTVADLKCFLASKKAKVGGKKDELIQRVTALLA